MRAVAAFRKWHAAWWKNAPSASAEAIAQEAFFAGWDARGRKPALPTPGGEQ